MSMIDPKGSGKELESMAIIRVINGEVPDQAAGMGMALAVRASGSVNDLTILEELDMKAVLAAAKKAAGAYKPAG